MNQGPEKVLELLREYALELPHIRATLVENHHRWVIPEHAEGRRLDAQMLAILTQFRTLRDDSTTEEEFNARNGEFQAWLAAEGREMQEEASANADLIIRETHRFSYATTSLDDLLRRVRLLLIEPQATRRDLLRVEADYDFALFPVSMPLLHRRGEAGNPGEDDDDE
jgi:hypothetical protein